MHPLAIYLAIGFGISTIIVLVVLALGLIEYYEDYYEFLKGRPKPKGISFEDLTLLFGAWFGFGLCYGLMLVIGAGSFIITGLFNGIDYSIKAILEKLK